MRVWRHLFLIVCFTAIASPLSAFWGCCGPCDEFCGFFVGVNGGAAMNTAETSHYATVVTDTDLTITLEAEKNVYQIRPWGEAFGGWGYQFCWLYLGGRFGINVSSYDPEAEFFVQTLDGMLNPPAIDRLTSRVKTQLNVVEYTLDFKPGVIFCNNTMLFGLCGAAFNQQCVRGKAHYLDGKIENDTIVPIAEDEIEVKKRKCCAALRGGVGIEHLFSPCVSVNLTYVYTHYWDFKKSVVSDRPFVTNGFEAIFSSEAHRHTMSMGLTLYF